MNKHLFLHPELLSRLIFTRTHDDKYFVRATLSQPPRAANPEEIIRQIFILSLIHQYRYPEECIELEHAVMMGRERKRADIVVKGKGGDIELVIEVKQIIDEDAINQLKSYLMATGAPVGAVVSGNEYRCFNRTATQLFEISDLPVFGEEFTYSIIDPIPSSTPAPTLMKAPTAPIDPIERFERVTLNRTRITIKGLTHEFSNSDLADFKKVRSRFVHDGVGIGTNIWKPAWLAIIDSHFENTPAPNVDSDEPLNTLSAQEVTFTESTPLSIPNPVDSASDIDPISLNTPYPLHDSLPDIYPFERFERVNRGNTRITIEGRTHQFTNEALASFKKVQRRYLADGIVFGVGMKSEEWLQIIKEQFARAPQPPTIDINISSSDGLRCLHHLFQQTVVTSLGGSEEERNSIRVLIERAQSPEWAAATHAKKLLRIHGIMIKRGSILIANHNNKLKELYKSSPWDRNWASALKSIGGVSAGSANSFGGYLSRTSIVPLIIFQEFANSIGNDGITTTAKSPDNSDIPNDQTDINTPQ